MNEEARSAELGEKGMEITEKDRRMARVCMDCKLCKHARAKQKGLTFWLVKQIEGTLCPWCKAYEKVYGRKAHEPLPSVPNMAEVGKEPH